jgi:hypothetical protein
MIRVVQAQPTALVLKLMWGEAFEGSLRSNGHKNGERHRPMGQMEGCGARFGDLGLSERKQALSSRASNILSISPAAQTRVPRAWNQAP